MKAIMAEKIKNKRNIIVALFFIIAILTRLVFIGRIPGNGALHSDEAYAGYNAWSLLHYGVDSEGYNNPVYFVTWGSGMNALEIYCMIPFVAIFGLNPVGIRMCLAIFGIITVIFFYKLLKDYASRNKAILGLAIIAIIPWHIMISRWGLESNFFPGFLLIAVYFLLFWLRGCDHECVRAGRREGSDGWGWYERHRSGCSYSAGKLHRYL